MSGVFFMLKYVFAKKHGKISKTLIKKMNENNFLQSAHYAVNPDYKEVIESNIELFQIINNCIMKYKKDMLKDLRNEIKEKYPFKKIKAKTEASYYRKKVYFTFEFEEMTFFLKTEYRENNNFELKLINMMFEVRNKGLSVINPSETTIEVEKNKQEKIQIAFKYYRNEHFFSVGYENKIGSYLNLNKFDKKENNISGNDLEFNQSFLDGNFDLYYSKLKDSSRKINEVVELNVLMNDMNVDEDLDFLISSESLNGIISNLKISKGRKPTLFNKIFKLK